MRRFLILYAVLFPIGLLVTVGTSIFVFRHLDLRTGIVISFLVVPAFQATVLCMVSRDFVPARLAADLGRLLRPLLSRLLLAAAAWILLIGWLEPRGPLGFAPDARLQALWSGLQALVAGALLALLLARLPRRNRAWPALLSIGLLGWGIDAFFPWIRKLPDLAFTDRPQIFRWMVVYGLLFVGALVALLGAGSRLEACREGAGLGVQLAVALAFLAALLAVPGYYLRPALVPPWRGLVGTCGSLAMTSLLLACLACLSVPPPKRRR